MDILELDRNGISIREENNLWFVTEKEYQEKEREFQLSFVMPETISFWITKQLGTADTFYLVPLHKVAIPRCEYSHQMLVNLLVNKADITSSQDIADYPLISELHLHKCFPDYVTIEKQTRVQVTTPSWLCSQRMQERIRKRAAETRAIKHFEAKRPSITIEFNEADFRD